MLSFGKRAKKTSILACVLLLTAVSGVIAASQPAEAGGL